MHVRSKGGFTLAELLVGLVISTMILGATASVFVTMLRGWEDGSRRREMLIAARTTADLIERHLRSAIPPGGYAVFRGADLSTADVAGHRLTLLSAAAGRFPRSLPRTDSSEIEFEFDPLTGDGMTLRIDSSPDDDPYTGGYRVQLSGLVRSFTVYYFDGVEWLEEWYDSRLPLAVEFRFTIAEPGDAPAAPADVATADPAPAPPPPQQVARLVWLPLAGAEQDGAGTTQTGPTSTPGQTGESGQTGQAGQTNMGGGIY
jgi:prepilin-type N-terminal cleavage/methylation domain-containing protein